MPCLILSRHSIAALKPTESSSNVDTVAVGLITGAGAIFTGILAPTVLYFNGRVDRKARTEAEERAARADQQKADLDNLRALAQEYRADIERLNKEANDYRTRDQVRQDEVERLQQRLAEEIVARQHAERSWHRLQARHPDD